MHVAEGADRGSLWILAKHCINFATDDEGVSTIDHLCCRDSQCGLCASFRTEASLCAAPGRGERGEGLQRGLHCLSRQRWKGCPDGEYCVSAAGYVSRFHGLRGNDA